MANEEHLAKLHEGVDAWNRWMQTNTIMTSDLRGENFIKADLSEADLSDTNLMGANLRGADLSNANLGRADLREAFLGGVDLIRADLSDAILIGADLRDANLLKANLRASYLSNANLSRADFAKANLIGANLVGANLTNANFSEVNLSWSNLSGANLIRAELSEADLSDANLVGANLRGANLRGVNLSRADLSGISLVRTILDDALLDNCRIYGISVWDVSLNSTSQKNLIITNRTEDAITVDDIKLGQFIHLLLRNEEIRDIIDTITSKVVLILGRFTEERKQILNSLRNELRRRDYMPILFDFEKPTSRDLTETILTLATMARFVIADISAAKSIPQELSHIIPHLPSVPVQPVLLASDRKYAMYEHWKRYAWVLPDFLYEDEAHLLTSLTERVIKPAEQKRQEQITE